MSTSPPPPSRSGFAGWSFGVDGSTGNWRLPSLENDEAVIGGVASGIAAELGVPTSWIRMAFVFLFALGGWGAFVYAFAWAGLHWARTADFAEIRSGPVEPRGRSEQQRRLAVMLITGGVALASATLMPLGSDVGFAVGFVIVGLGLAWRTSTSTNSSDAPMPGRIRIRQLLGGLALVVGGLSILLLQLGPGSTSTFVVGAALIGLVGTIVVSGPWIMQVLSDFDSERQARIRSEERAEVAAHLHDSVLQTLSLIQKAEDPQIAANLARRQERELRNWLDPNRASRMGGSIRGQLDEMASDLEERYGTPVEVVAVGDALVDPAIAALLRATREAAINAAQHSGTPRVDIFVEVGEDHVELFVRDTGSGFDPEAVDGDRRGVRESIVGRMERAGGSALITSEAGEGTEIELRVPLSAEAEAEPGPVPKQRASRSSPRPAKRRRGRRKQKT
ncbi:MAG: PspC domain-containing protein [Acidimicrobiales bacterium]|nr:PspC domain-containing protein [Acidimicrobiales bacterium]